VKIFLLILVDQIFKFLALRWKLALINKGIAFGLFSPIKSFFIFLFLFLLILLLFSIYYFKKHHFKYVNGLKLILAGGLSNLLDRIIYKGVIDYFHLPLIPNFNLADLVITLGFILLLKNIILKKN